MCPGEPAVKGMTDPDPSGMDGMTDPDPSGMDGMTDPDPSEMDGQLSGVGEVRLAGSARSD
ncbi:unnamed protein product, partial [Staurois parvus]